MSITLKLIQQIVKEKYQQKQKGPFKPVKGFYLIQEVTVKEEKLLPPVSVAKVLWKESRNKKFVKGTETEIFLSFLFSRDCQYPKSLTPNDLKGKLIEVKYTDYQSKAVTIEWDLVDCPILEIKETTSGASWVSASRLKLGDFYTTFYNSQSQHIQQILDDVDFALANPEDYQEELEDPNQYVEEVEPSYDDGDFHDDPRDSFDSDSHNNPADLSEDNHYSKG